MLLPLRTPTEALLNYCIIIFRKPFFLPLSMRSKPPLTPPRSTRMFRMRRRNRWGRELLKEFSDGEERKLPLMCVMMERTRRRRCQLRCRWRCVCGAFFQECCGKKPTHIESQSLNLKKKKLRGEKIQPEYAVYEVY